MHKIAIIDHVGGKAGMDYYSSSLAKGFVNQKYSCTVYSNFTGIEPDKINYKLYYEGHVKRNLLLKLLRFVSATLKSSYDARKIKTDLVILHLFSANIVTLLLIMIPKFFGLKTTIISHDVSSFTDNDSTFIQNLIYKPFSDHIIVHNKFSYDELVRNIKLNIPKKVTIIKHGGYLDHIGERPDKVSIRKELGLESDGKYILFFGQIKKAKGLDVLLKALSMVPDHVKLIIAGKPWKANFDNYEKLIEHYKLQDRIVKKICFIEDDEREKLFFSADVNILPYRVIYQSGVLLMAMSHGLPVIASNLPSNIEIIVNRKNGMLFKSEDADDLAMQIISFFQDKSLQKSMASNASKTIENDYGWNGIAKKYIELLS